MDEKLRKLKLWAEKDPSMATKYRAELARLHLIPSDAEVASIYTGAALGNRLGTAKALRIWVHMLRELGQSAHRHYLSAITISDCSCEGPPHEEYCDYSGSLDARNEEIDNFQDFMHQLREIIIYLEKENAPWKVSDLDEMIGFCHEYLGPMIALQNTVENLATLHLECVLLLMEGRSPSLVLYFGKVPRNLPVSEPDLIEAGALSEFNRYRFSLRIAVQESAFDFQRRQGAPSDGSWHYAYEKLTREKATFVCRIEWDTGLRRGSPQVPFFGDLPAALQDDPGAWQSWFGQ